VQLFFFNNIYIMHKGYQQFRLASSSELLVFVRSFIFLSLWYQAFSMCQPSVCAWGERGSRNSHSLCFIFFFI